MYAIRSYYGCSSLPSIELPGPCGCFQSAPGTVITSYSIHYTKLYENKAWSSRALSNCSGGMEGRPVWE